MEYATSFSLAACKERCIGRAAVPFFCSLLLADVFCLLHAQDGISDYP